MSANRHRYATAQAAAEACADDILHRLGMAIASGRDATLAVSGGTTPALMFDAMVRASGAAHFPWDRVQLFWVDERAVAPTDARSNYKLAREHLIEAAGIPEHNVHRVVAELDPGEAARRYTDELRASFHLEPGAGAPRFDVIHRGMGPDAHTASLFPGEPLIADREHLAAAVYVQKFAQWRITLLPAVLLAAAHTAMLVTGGDKAAALRSVLRERYDPSRWPAQLGTQQEEQGLDWYLDEAAARGLD